MPLLNPSNESNTGSPLEEITGSLTLQPNRVEAAQEVLELLSRYFGGSNQAHCGTVLSAAAWLAGTSLFRSFGYPQLPEPGSVMLSEQANTELPKLLSLFSYYLYLHHIVLKSDQLVTDVPDQHKPVKTILQIQEANQDEYNLIMRTHGLDYMDGARAGIIACSILFQYYCVQEKDIQPPLGAGIISRGLVTGAKTVPLPLKSGNPAVPTSPAQGTQNKPKLDGLETVAGNSISGTGTRLVLGEAMTAAREAVDKGGRFILLHPEVLKKLKEKNIDAFVIYEAALRIETKAKISRIDYISGNVAELLQEWNGKEHLAPIHVRQVLWLHTYARSLGYERHGNSWVLK